MTGVRARGEDIRRYIIDNVEKHPGNISKVTAEKFDITRQAVNKHLQRLTEERVLAESGNTRSRVYKLAPLVEWRHSYELIGSPVAPAEDVVWTNDVRLALGQLPDNIFGRSYWT